jgi:uncharacterized protein
VGPAPAAGWFVARKDGVDMRVRLTPKGGRDRLEAVAQLSDGSAVLAARVRAAPEKGAANKALERLIAAALGVAPATVSVASGHKGRLKTLHVAGDADALTKALGDLAIRMDAEKTR